MSKIIHKNPHFQEYIKSLTKMKYKQKTQPTIKVGFPAGKVSQKYPGGTSVIDVAVWNNFGTDTIPERPFMSLSRGIMLNETKKMRQSLLKVWVESCATNSFDKDEFLKAMDRIGAKSSAIMKRVITELSEPPNAPSTIEAKGSSNPLIDTGLMRSSVTWQVFLPKDL